MSSACPWPLVFAYDRAADTLRSTVVAGEKVLLAFPDLAAFRVWQQRPENTIAAPFVDDDPVTVLPILRMMLEEGGNSKLAVMHPDPPDKWRVVQFELAGVIRQLEKAID